MSDKDKRQYIEWLLDPNTILKEGDGRHPATVTIGMQFYNTSLDGMLDKTDDEVKAAVWNWHIQHCKPPRSEKEFEGIMKWI